jgi:hypothetical protein
MKSSRTWMVVMAVPFGVVGSWLAARVWFALGALVFAVQMVVGKLVLIAVAAALGVAFAHAAHAQGNAGFIYRQMYNDLGRFGGDLIVLGRAYDAGVSAVLQSESGQQFITYTFTANANSSGQDLVRATLESRNSYQQPTVVQVFVNSFGGSMIGSLSAGLFANSGNNGTHITTILQYQPQRVYDAQRAYDASFQHALQLARSFRFQH